VFKKLLSALSLVGALLLLLVAGRGAEPAEVPAPISTLVKALEVGRPASHDNLTIVPVYSRRIVDKTAYATFEDAVKNKWIDISEVEGGRVPQVKISNLSGHKIFLMGGEILTGCKQDRILAQSLLLAPGTKNLLAPVFCVEQGRWTEKSANFTTKSNIGTFKLRAKAQKGEAEAQSEIWSQIHDQNRMMNVPSATGAYQEAYDKKENEAAIKTVERKMAEELQFLDDTVGVLIALGDRIVSVDIFANPHLFKKEWPKILKSSALSSLVSNRAGSLTQGDAAEFLKEFINRDYRRKAALDLGYNLESENSSASVNALVLGDAVIHLAGFPSDDERVKIIGSRRDQRLPVLRDETPSLRKCPVS